MYRVKKSEFRVEKSEYRVNVFVVGGVLFPSIFERT